MPDAAIHSVTRRWWAGELGTAGGVLDLITAPLEALYRVGVAARNRAFTARVVAAHRVELPVVSVGNVTVGGTGKTPFAHHVARLLRSAGLRPAILHGGYADDEPALHREWTPEIPVIVDRDRVRGARRAGAAGANIVVLDDGFQHRRLARDLDIVLIAAERWPGMHRLLPRGPWREPATALRRADLIVVTRKTAGAAAAMDVRRALLEQGMRDVLLAHIQPAQWQHEGGAAAAPTRAALAVAAVAEPALFLENARSAGATVRALHALPDHHSYTGEDAHDIRQRAGAAPIVTTEKDWVKLRQLLPADRVWILVQRVVVEHGADMLEARLRALGHRVEPAERPRT